MAAEKINASGLRALRNAFKATGDRAWDRRMGKVHKRIAERVVTAARPGIAAVSSSTAGAVSAVTSALGARIKVDRADVPQAAGVIFGSGSNVQRRGPSGRVFVGYNQFRSWWAGPYHLWPELDSLRDSIAEEYAAEVQQFLTDHGVPR